MTDIAGRCRDELASKTYGKAKIYYLNQNQLPVPSEADRAQIEQQISALDGECAAVEQELKASESALASVNAQLSDVDLELKLQELSKETEALDAKLEHLERPDRPTFAPGHKDALKRKFIVYKVRCMHRFVANETSDASDDCVDCRKHGWHANASPWTLWTRSPTAWRRNPRPCWSCVNSRRTLTPASRSSRIFKLCARTNRLLLLLVDCQLAHGASDSPSRLALSLAPFLPHRSPHQFVPQWVTSHRSTHTLLHCL